VFIFSTAVIDSAPTPTRKLTITTTEAMARRTQRQQHELLAELVVAPTSSS